MKLKLYILTLLFIIASCSSPEHKARRAITENLKITLHDFKSYESVKFGTLDSLYSDVSTSPDYSELNAKRESWIRAAEKEHELDLEKIQKAINDGNLHHLPIIQEFSLEPRCNDSAESYSVRMQTIKDSYKPRFIGWSMTHLYRAKNLEGNFKLTNESFYFDKEFSKVVGSIDISE